MQAEAHFHCACKLGPRLSTDIESREPCRSRSVLSLEPLAVQDRHPGSGCATWARNTHRFCRLDHFAPKWIVTKRWPHHGGRLVDVAHQLVELRQVPGIIREIDVHARAKEVRHLALARIVSDDGYELVCVYGPDNFGRDDQPLIAHSTGSGFSFGHVRAGADE